MGPAEHADVGGRRPHLQHRRVQRDHADGVEARQRPRQELAARLQGARPARLHHQDGQRAGERAPPPPPVGATATHGRGQDFFAIMAKK